MLNLLWEKIFIELSNLLISSKSINNEKWDLVCRSVLDYYDKCYEFEKVGKTNIKVLDLTDKKYDERILELINNVLWNNYKRI